MAHRFLANVVPGTWYGLGCWCLKRQGLGKAGSRPYHSSYFVIYFAYAQLKKNQTNTPKQDLWPPTNAPGRVMAWNILCPGCWRPRDVAQAPHWYLLRWSLPGKGRLSPEVISQTLTGSGGGLFLDHLGSFAPTASADDMGQCGAALARDYSFGYGYLWVRWSPDLVWTCSKCEGVLLQYGIKYPEMRAMWSYLKLDAPAVLSARLGRTFTDLWPLLKEQTNRWSDCECDVQ